LGGATGARVTKRYVDGVVTNDNLWPWPMDDRIWNETGDASLWQNANPMFPAARRRSATWDGVNGRTGGLWKVPPP
jgi:hypothetical protein